MKTPVGIDFVQLAGDREPLCPLVGGQLGTTSGLGISLLGQPLCLLIQNLETLLVRRCLAPSLLGCTRSVQNTEHGDQHRKEIGTR